jgi:lipopolysaccharide/colanic/teichoic acid biosynthesis glycosyltransferase
MPVKMSLKPFVPATNWITAHRRVGDCCAGPGGCSPIIFLAALAIVITRRPAFFRQERVGVDGTIFRLIKLRTMRSSEGGGPQVTAADDARVTPVGRALRTTKLDELPQLLNVVKGDMSLVGPRPEVPRYVDPENSLWGFLEEARLLTR